MADKDKAIQQMKVMSQTREAQKSARTRRRAREIFTDLKATGKISPDMKFEDLPEGKFFKAAEDIKESEMKREMLNSIRDMQKKRQAPVPMNRKR